MNQSLIDAAREAGFEFPDDYDCTEPIKRLEAFDRIRRRQERERIAALEEALAAALEAISAIRAMGD